MSRLFAHLDWAERRPALAHAVMAPLMYPPGVGRQLIVGMDDLTDTRHISRLEIVDNGSFATPYKL